MWSRDFASEVGVLYDTHLLVIEICVLSFWFSGLWVCGLCCSIWFGIGLKVPLGVDACLIDLLRCLVSCSTGPVLRELR